jgi:hypothetical protein
MKTYRSVELELHHSCPQHYLINEEYIGNGMGESGFDQILGILPEFTCRD